MLGTKKSFSEAEHDEAVAAGKSILMYLTPEEFPIPGSMIERDEIREKQASFRARVAQRHTVAAFQPGQEKELAGFVIQTLHNRRDDAVKEGTLQVPKAVTRLLFPFVTNIGGFDTGITISNVSHNPFGSEQQDGTVTIYYHGRVVGGPVRPAPQTSGFAFISALGAQKVASGYLAQTM